jgi:hypothetical protein
MTSIIRNLLAATGVLFLLGCEGAVDPSPTQPAAANVFQAANILSPPLGGLAVCPKATYDSASALIGPKGGVVKVGAHKFEVPAGALSFLVRITMVRPADSTASVRLYPQGLKFNASALPKLTLDFTSCKQKHVTWMPPRIAYVSEQTGILEILTTILLDKLGYKVSAKVSHFSRYAVAW